jgi:hypothetical protein
MAFCNTNPIYEYDILKLKTPNTKDEYIKSEIYKLNYSTCEPSYVGQTSHNLKLGYQENIRCKRNSDPQQV